MRVLTERQRAEAIAACDRILKANDNLQRIAADIRKGIEKMNKSPLVQRARLNTVGTDDGFRPWTGSDGE